MVFIVSLFKGFILQMQLKNRGHYSGQGMVEFAIVFPLLLIVLFGIFEFGRVMFAYSSVIAASREGARYGAAIQDIGGGIPQYEDCQGIKESVQRIGRFAAVSDSNISIQYSDDSGVYSTSCPPGQDVGLTDTITVTVDTIIKPITPLGEFSEIPLTSSASRTILRKVKLGESGTGAGSVQGAVTDVNFKTTMQTAEETKGTITAVLELNQTAVSDVTVPFSVTGTAVKDVDYTITSSPVIIPAGFSTATIQITINNDGLVEGDEALFIGINTPTNATKGPQDIHMVTIVDPPDVSFEIASSQVNESTGYAPIKLILTKASTQDVTVPLVRAGSADYGAASDYTLSPNPVVIHAGTLSSSVMIAVNDDLIDENNETVALGIDPPSNANLGDIPMHILTINDNDDPPEASFYTHNVVVSEEIGTFITTIRLSEVSSKEITLPYSLSGTTTSGDYLIYDPSPLTIPAGNKTVQIQMDILEGDGWEVDESLIVTLENPTNASLGSPAAQTIIITESSAQPSVTFTSSSQSVSEGSISLDVFVQMSNAWSSEVTIPVTISGSASQGADQDYQIDSTTLVIPTGFVQGHFSIQIQDDELDESDKTLTLTMGAISNGIPGSITSHTVTIIDDDAAPEINFVGASLDRAEADGTSTLTVQVDHVSAEDITIPLTFAGTAQKDSDYTASTETLTIPAGQLEGSFQVTLIDDTSVESEEAISIELGSPTNAVLGSSSTFTINVEDNELPLCEVGTHMLTIGSDSFTLSISNQGEALFFTGGSVSWPKSSGNSPQLNLVEFAGEAVFTGSEKPTSHSYSTAKTMDSLATNSLVFSFDSTLGSGQNTVIANFQNQTTGASCSVTEEFTTY
jgi:Flp pilus assembly protein TadG